MCFLVEKSEKKLVATPPSATFSHSVRELESMNSNDVWELEKHYVRAAYAQTLRVSKWSSFVRVKYSRIHMELRSKAVAALMHSVLAIYIYEVNVLSKYTIQTMVEACVIAMSSPWQKKIRYVKKSIAFVFSVKLK